MSANAMPYLPLLNRVRNKPKLAHSPNGAMTSTARHLLVRPAKSTESAGTHAQEPVLIYSPTTNRAPLTTNSQVVSVPTVLLAKAMAVFEKMNVSVYVAAGAIHTTKLMTKSVFHIFLELEAQ